MERNSDWLGIVRKIGILLTEHRDWNGDTFDGINHILRDAGLADNDDQGFFRFLDPEEGIEDVYRCGYCGNPDVEEESWVHMNTNTPTDGSGDDNFCACCDEMESETGAGHEVPICDIVRKEDGTVGCNFHGPEEARCSDSQSRCCARYTDFESPKFKEWQRTCAKRDAAFKASMEATP